MLEDWKRLSEELKIRDEKLRPLILAIGEPHIQFQKNAFRALTECILSQQLAPKAARTIIDRFTALERPFPLPASVSVWPIKKLKSAGVSPQKTVYLKELSRAWSDRSWRMGWNRLNDEELTARLTEIKGIGVWTAHMFLIFSLGRPDVLPIGDYGIRRGVQILYGLKDLPEPAVIPHLVPHWKGAASIGSWYLWQALDRKLL